MGVRRLYEGLIRSRVLYGAPVWAEDLAASRRNLTLVRRLHRTIAIRAARGYRTVSYATATVLAAPPPIRATGPCPSSGVRTSEGRDLGPTGHADGINRGCSGGSKTRSMGAVALAAVGRGCGTPSSGRPRRPAQLGQVERQRRGPAHIQDDSGALFYLPVPS